MNEYQEINRLLTQLIVDVKSLKEENIKLKTLNKEYKKQISELQSKLNDSTRITQLKRR